MDLLRTLFRPTAFIPSANAKDADTSLKYLFKALTYQSVYGGIKITRGDGISCFRKVKPFILKTVYLAE